LSPTRWQIAIFVGIVFAAFTKATAPLGEADPP